jgi:hypothetical protein
MSDDAAGPPLPEAFLALFVPPGRVRPTASRAHIAARHELCEDLAQLLTDTARQQLWALGITEDLVLQRIHAGLPETGLELSPAESWWVTRRLAEVLNWHQPDWLPATAPGDDETAT